uniref:Carboxypeptidase M n=1 Tax=Astyanax mexicanus TaxID=7994 RepID=A0A8B9HQJ8_ASTMX
MLLLVLCCLWITPSSFALEFKYHNSVQVGQYLTEVSRNYSDITYLHSIGQSVEGRELWVLILGQNPKQHRTGIPEFKYVGNMHGNEVLGRVLLLQLIDYLTKGYLRDPLVTRLLNSTRIHILPSMNPDGFESSGRDCMYSQGSALAFLQTSINLANVTVLMAERLRDPQVRQCLTLAVTQTLSSRVCVCVCSSVRGWLMWSYCSELQGGSSVSPDNDVFVHLSKTYSRNHTSMYKGDSCFDSKDFSEGITNGYSWYPLEGGMQDYNYVWGQCLEITLELSCCKFPPESELPGLWDANRAALLAYMQQVHLGLKGQVLDSNGIPIQNASVEVEGRRNLCPFMTDRNGEYYRLLLPGSYTIKVTHPGHESVTETISVPYGPDRFSALTHNFQLQKSSSQSTPGTTVQPTCTPPGLNLSNNNNSAALLPSLSTALAAYCLLLHTLQLS